MIYYISTTGNDAAGHTGDPTAPYRTWAAIHSLVKSGDTIIYRGGVYTEQLNLTYPFVVGAPGSPVTIKAYLNERPVVNAIYPLAMGARPDIPIHDVVVDGLELTSPDPTQGFGVQGFYWQRVTLRNLNVHHNYEGMRIQSGLSDVLIENSRVHDNTQEHGIYLGCGKDPCTNVTVRGCECWNNTRNGIQFNGRVTNLQLLNNILHDNAMAGLSLLQGVHRSFIRGNIIYGNAKQGIIVANYIDTQPELAPYDQVDNLFEDNTVMATGDFEAVGIDNPTGKGDLGGNVFYRNVLSTQYGPVFWFRSGDYAKDTTIIDNDLRGPTLMRQAKQDFTPEQFAAFSPRFIGNRSTT